MTTEETTLTVSLIAEAKKQGELEGFKSCETYMKNRFKDKFFLIVDKLNKFSEEDNSSEETIKFVNELIDTII